MTLAQDHPLADSIDTFSSDANALCGRLTAYMEPFEADADVERTDAYYAAACAHKKLNAAITQLERLSGDLRK